MWHRQHRNSVYPFISGAGTTALLAFLATSALLQIASAGDKAQVARLATEWRTLISLPAATRHGIPEFSLAFSDPPSGAAQRN